MWLLLGCAVTKSPEGVAPAAVKAPLEIPQAVAQGTELKAVGEAGWSFVYASSLSGRTVVLVEFGTQMPTFGHHGEPFGAEPAIRAWDSVTGSSSELVDLAAVSADRRHLLVEDAGGIWLVDDAGSWRHLDDISAEGDGNRCLPPRQAAFSPDGSKVSWVNGDSTALTVEDLDTGAQWQVLAEGTLWRGWPDNGGQGATLLELQTGEAEDASGLSWPLQRTSCACRWCGMFAMSYGVYGWSGPEYEMVHVDGAGSRGEPVEEDGGGPMHGANAQGCTLQSASPIEEPLQHGPWTWACSE